MLETSHIHLSEDADKLAIDDLTRQVKGERGPVASLIRARRDQLRTEVEAERGFILALKRTRKSLVDLMRDRLR
jgi:CelD/BcsL family acetyltransferase involved in cellulose biosynthesis